MKRAILTTFLWGGLFSLHAQNIVVIGEVKNVEEGTTFHLEETTGTGSTRLWSRDADEDIVKDIYMLHAGQIERKPDFRGKYVLVDFWANYCGPCIASFPQLKKLQEIHADRLVVISLSIDKVPFWRTLSHHKDMTWLSLNDGGGNFGGLAGSYDVKALPTYILIAPDGMYKARLDASAIYNGTLEKYLKNKI